MTTDPLDLPTMVPSTRPDAATVARQLVQRWSTSGNWYQRLARSPSSIQRTTPLLYEGRAVLIRISEQSVTIEQKTHVQAGRGSLPRVVDPASLPNRTGAFPLTTREKPFVKSAHEQRCDKCNGTGRQDCPQCRGRPTHQCSQCNGNPRKPISCHDCEGTGHRRPLTGSFDEHTRYDAAKYNSEHSASDAASNMTWHNKRNGADWIVCRTCSGSGKVTAVCQPCRGRGEITCEHCHGEGKIGCKPCEGGGAMHHIVTAERVFKAKEVAQVLNDCGARARDVVRSRRDPTVTQVMALATGELKQVLHRANSKAHGPSEEHPLVVQRFEAACSTARFSVSGQGYAVALLEGLSPKHGTLSFAAPPPIDPEQLAMRRYLTIVAAAVLAAVVGIIVSIIWHVLLATVVLTLIGSVAIVMGIRGVRAGHALSASPGGAGRRPWG